VIGADGRPIPGCTVRVEQQRHHFHFGTAAPAGRFLDQTNPDNLRFQQEVQRLYNVVTFENDLKWAAANPNQLANVDKAIDWLRERNIDVRGHCLLWGSYQHLPQAVRDLRGDALLQACEDHVAEYAGHTRGQLYLWDVVNEAGSNTELWDEIGWESFADSFRWAREADPDVRLCYNDYGIVNLNPGYRAQVKKRIEYLVDQDAPFDALGIQGHMGLPLTPLHTVLEILDEWAAFGKDLEITEFDLGCANDEVHAQYVRDFMTAVFSHPKVTAFIMWGFWEGSHWRAKDGGTMFRRDWSARPAQEAWEDLVLNQWWTKAEAKTGEDGAATVRAFYGTHEVTVEQAGKRATATVELLPDGTGTAELRLP
jgi:GH35 family endo-1,4-beta-xylanase